MKKASLRIVLPVLAGIILGNLLFTAQAYAAENPVVTALSPEDDATGVAIDADLSLTFSKEVGWESGDIVIRRADDDTIAETIPVGGGPVSGSGTDTLTIHPQYDLDYDTEYYVEIPDTAVRDTVDGLYFAGISGSAAWSFTTEEDEVAPVLTEITGIPDPVPTVDAAVYHFQTDEYCEVSVLPPTSDTGTVEPLAEEVVVGQDIGITLTGMQAGGTYSFSFVCTDAASNESNRLSVGPFTIESAPSEHSSRSNEGGTSVRSQVANLIAIGNQERANQLMAKYPALFGRPQTVPGNPSTPAAVRDLLAGLEGEDVRMLQALLIRAGYSIPAGATGYFGSQTHAALSSYQRDHGIAPAAGYFGPVTRAQMKAAGLEGLWW